MENNPMDTTKRWLGLAWWMFIHPFKAAMRLSASLWRPRGSLQVQVEDGHKEELWFLRCLLMRKDDELTRIVRKFKIAEEKMMVEFHLANRSLGEMMQSKFERLWGQQQQLWMLLDVQHQAFERKLKVVSTDFHEEEKARTVLQQHVRDQEVLIGQLKAELQDKSSVIFRLEGELNGRKCLEDYLQNKIKEQETFSERRGKASLHVEVENDVFEKEVASPLSPRERERQMRKRIELLEDIVEQQKTREADLVCQVQDLEISSRHQQQRLLDQVQRRFESLEELQEKSELCIQHEMDLVLKLNETEKQLDLKTKQEQSLKEKVLELEDLIATKFEPDLKEKESTIVSLKTQLAQSQENEKRSKSIIKALDKQHEELRTLLSRTQANATQTEQSMLQKIQLIKTAIEKSQRDMIQSKQTLHIKMSELDAIKNVQQEQEEEKDPDHQSSEQ